jgi:PAS domain S-box-containing protein
MVRITALEILGRKHWVSVQEDVTERRRAEQALPESEERYRSLVAVSSSMVWAANPQGRFAEPQPSWEAYTGQAWKTHLGIGWVEALHPDDRERVRATREQVRDQCSLYASEGRLWHAPSGIYQLLQYTGDAAPQRQRCGAVVDRDGY